MGNYRDHNWKICIDYLFHILNFQSRVFVNPTSNLLRVSTSTSVFGGDIEYLLSDNEHNLCPYHLDIDRGLAAPASPSSFPNFDDIRGPQRLRRVSCSIPWIPPHNLVGVQRQAVRRTLHCAYGLPETGSSLLRNGFSRRGQPCRGQ
jgi:hypothetical protein